MLRKKSLFLCCSQGSIYAVENSFLNIFFLFAAVFINAAGNFFNSAVIIRKQFHAATPSAAAEICVPEFDSLKNMLLRQRETMHKASDDMLTAAKMRIDACLKSRALTSPLRVTEL